MLRRHFRNLVCCDPSAKFHHHQNVHLHPCPLQAQRREPTPPWGRQRGRSLHELQDKVEQWPIKNTRGWRLRLLICGLSLCKPAFGCKCDDYICFVMVHFDEVQGCCITPHFQGCMYCVVHFFLKQISGVFCNPVDIRRSAKHAETCLMERV